MADASDLIRQRRQQTETQAVNHALERAKQTQESHTGENFQYDGRNPATGDLQLRRGDQRISARGISNSELTPTSPVQISDTGSGTPIVDFAPSPPEQPIEPDETSENQVGTMAYLVDSIVSGEVATSCRSLQDVWALFAIIQYVKAPRTMVLFSFPKETNTPVPYTCPRYRFGQQDSQYRCIPTPDLTSAYGSLGECQTSNPVTCPGTEPEGEPFDPETGYPPNISRISYFPPAQLEQTNYVSTSYTGSNPVSWYNVSVPETSTRSARQSLASSNNAINPTYERSFITSWTVFGLATRFFQENGRAPRCGDTITVNAEVISYTLGARKVTRYENGDTFTEGGSHYGITKKTETRTFSYQNVSQIFLDFVQVNSSFGCGNYDPVIPEGDSEPYENPPETYPECTPPEGEPSTIERQFWIGGHIKDPIQLFSINAEEEFYYFGSLMPDGYYVTLKHGREKVNGVEQWCKTETKKTTNLVDWRTVAYHNSLDLNPSLPPGSAGELITTNDDNGNMTDKGAFTINPAQTVAGAGNVSRTLAEELLVRPEGVFIETLISADLKYTDLNATELDVNTQIYRIVDAIPTELDQDTGCVEVTGVELSYSPLFLI